MGATASAPAKTILFGEHFVVYGEPAVVLAIDKRAYARAEERRDRRLSICSANLNLSGNYDNGDFTVECGDVEEAKSRFEPIRLAVEKIFEKKGEKVGLDIEIDSAIPVAAGLGSSAAVVAAAAAAVGALLGIKLAKEEIFRITYEAERVVHGSPSGIDPAIATYGGAMLYQIDKGFKPLNVKVDVPLVIGDTGLSRSTRVQVEKVRRLSEKYPQILASLMLSARETVSRAVEALSEGDLETVGELMNINHGLLCSVGVSDESLERLVHAAREAGALGAKLTGAGGGGCIIALTERQRLEQVMRAMMRVGGKAFTAEKTDEGVKVEST